MEISEKITQEFYQDIGEERLEKANLYVKQNRVKITKAIYDNKSNFELLAEINGNNDNYTTRIKIVNGQINDVTCQCQDYLKRYGSCKHIVATLIKFKQTKYWDKEYMKETIYTKPSVKFAAFRKVVTELYNEELQEINLEEEEKLSEEDKIKIEPKILLDRFDNILKLEVKIGTSRMYKVKDLAEFYTRMVRKEFYKYGDKLEFVHIRENFKKSCQNLLEFILRYSEMLKYAQNASRYTYYGNTLNLTSITLGESSIDSLFEILKNQEVIIDKDRETRKVYFLEQNPNIKFELIKDGDNYKIKPNKEIFGIYIFKGKEHTYILDDKGFYRCNEQYENSIIKLIRIFKESYTTELDLAKEDLKDFYSVIMPRVNNCIQLSNISEKEMEQYKPKKLGVKIYLDFDKNNFLIAEVKFCYGDEEFNSLAEDVQIVNPRNILSENKSLNILRKTGFMIDKKNLRFVLPENDKIYNFLSNDIELYMQKFEVLITENFKAREIKRPKIGTIGVKIENNLLSIDLSKIDINGNELQEIMEKYKLKKKYYRLKDGSFLDLDENPDLNFLDKLFKGMNLDYKDLNKDLIKLPVNRIMYLNELLKREKINVSKDNEFKKIISDLEKDNLNNEIQIPPKMNTILRDYQKTGYRWLKTIDLYHFGGILADDMGLGKTLQVLSVLLDYKEQYQDVLPSLVVCPSSLTLNWLNETRKFSPELKAIVIKGTANERKKIIENIKQYNLVITSYDSLKRDIDIYTQKKYTFRYIIADEAQYMKNSTTQNAKTIKKIDGVTRFALTGTPIENSLAELWSIFDFIMPGYLFDYKIFKTQYEIPIVKESEEDAINRLKMLIAPFILRRNKLDVLTELPEKTITVLNNQMTEEQEKIYMSYLIQAREDVANEINLNGFEKSQFKILATLTRLRQICCHPSLFIKDYTGESSKLNQCIDIINDAIEAGHKILLFSGYTSMFEIIEKELKSKKIQYFKLTGSTKVDERIKLVDEFNSNVNIKLFLISLKAGGTGLNLTGADMVIHYDPWWNQSAENQATDRAYRIGQKNNVQVYKLITSNSIEDKIYELQNKKAKLADNMLENKTVFINKFSKEDIMNLFE